MNRRNLSDSGRGVQRLVRYAISGCVAFILVCFSTLNLAADVPLTQREYPLALGDKLDSRNVVRTSIAFNKLGYDLFNKGASDFLPPRYAGASGWF